MGRKCLVVQSDLTSILFENRLVDGLQHLDNVQSVSSTRRSPFWKAAEVADFHFSVIRYSSRCRIRCSGLKLASLGSTDDQCFGLTTMGVPPSVTTVA